MAHFTYIGGNMVATTTVNGHISRAVAFQAKTDIWLGVGRQTPWDEAQLTGTVAAVAGNMDLGGDDTLTLLIDLDIAGDPEYTVNVTFSSSGSIALSVVVNEINAAWMSAGGSGTIASSVLIGTDNFLKITSPSTGSTAMVKVGTDDNAGLGLAADTVQYGYDTDPPPSEPTAEEVEEVAGYKKADQTTLVVPDADTAAEIVSTVDGSSGYTITDTTLDLEVDDIGVVNITFIPGGNTITDIINKINSDYQDAYLVAKGFATADTIASEQVEGPASYIRLLSPNPGGISLLEIGADDNSEIGFAVSHPDNPSSGHAGGSIYYRDTQWRIVLPANAYDEGARWVYLEASLLYDEFVLPLTFRQVGWYSGLEVVGAHIGEDPIMPDWREPDTGILEVIDNRQLVNRAADEYEKIKIIIEF